MMAQRKCLFFCNMAIDEDTQILTFHIRNSTEKMRFRFTINLSAYEKELRIEYGDRIIRVWKNDESLREVETNFGSTNSVRIDGPEENLLAWWTPDSLLFRSQKNYCINMVIPKEFYSFSLKYIGISKRNNSVSRLFDTPHHKRVDILTNEHPMDNDSRVSDELMIFLFDICWIETNITDTQNIEAVRFIDSHEDRIRLIADAEKAFVSQLSPSYNDELYKNYPTGSDGIFSEQIDEYCYAIAENITFQTDSTTLKGCTNDNANWLEKIDYIIVSGNSVSICKMRRNNHTKLIMEEKDSDTTEKGIL